METTPSAPDNLHEEPQPADTLARPGMASRLFAAIPLLILFLIFAGTMCTVPKFEHMFKEMDLGDLPVMTTCVLFLVNSVNEFIYLFLPMLFAIAWFYFTWGCRDRQRMFWISWAMAMLDVGLFFFIQFALYMPMISIMEKLGR